MTYNYDVIYTLNVARRLIFLVSYSQISTQFLISSKERMGGGDRLSGRSGVTCDIAHHKR